MSFNRTSMRPNWDVASEARELRLTVSAGFETMTEIYSIYTARIFFSCEALGTMQVLYAKQLQDSSTLVAPDRKSVV